MTLSILLIGSACTWKSPAAPSSVVILVENLGFGAFSCGEVEGRRQGLQSFCDEAVRFTHAYTPSLMSQATVASILTSKFPYEHGVRTNGPQSLSAREETLAEKALARGYRTAFFTGGPPIWRRSGLSQGFEIFDDNVAVNWKSLYRAAPDVVSLFLNWLDIEGSRGRLFSFLYFADLQFVDAPTLNELGEQRESSYRSQVDELDSALGVLVREMKRRKVWDSTNVFLIGLQGYASELRTDELPSASLFSDSTRATLMIKPARAAGAGPGPGAAANWKIDANVSLVDVGATLLDLIGAGKTPRPPRELDAEAKSLKTALVSNKVDWPLDRLVLSESAWPLWRSLGGVRTSVRQGPYLFVFDQTPRLYDTLADSSESTRVSASDAMGASLREELGEYLRSIGAREWIAPARVVVDRLALGHDLWRERDPSSDTLARLRVLNRRYGDDAQLRGWRALWAIRKQNWSELKFAALNPATAIQPLWAYVASRNLGEKTSAPTDPCFDFVRGPLGSRPLPKECRLEALPDLLVWANESAPEGVRAKAQEAFWRHYSSRALATRVAEHNQAAGLRWDAGFVEGPDSLDLILALPEMRRVRTRLEARRL